MKFFRSERKLQNSEGKAFRKTRLDLFFRTMILTLAVCFVFGYSERAAAAYDPAKPLPALTGKYIYDFLRVAESQLGYHESADTSETVYSDWAGQSGRAWCSEFLSWCAYQAGIPETVIPKKNGAKSFRTFFSNQGTYFLVEGGIGDEGCGCETAAAGTIPASQIRPGDILIIETAGSNNLTTLDHVAVCRGISITGDKVTILTFEGNINRNYTIDGKTVKLGTVIQSSRNVGVIHGICRPIYGDFCDAYGEHTWNSGSIARSATCTEAELVQYTCQLCGDTKTVENDKLPHRETTDQAVAATCETAGLTAGSHCADCGAVVKTQQSVKAKGHTWDAGKVQVEAKTLTEGWMRYTCTVCGETKTECIPATGAPAVGTRISDRKTEAVYIVTKAGTKGGTVAYAGPTDRQFTEVTIRSKVTLDDITYSVTSIADGAFANNKYIKSVVIPSSVKQIGSKAFYKCSKLKSITVKSKGLKKKTIGAQAFKGIHKNAVFYVPAKKKSSYQKIFRTKGAGAKSVFRTY